MNSPIPELVVVHEHPVKFLGELAWDAVRALSVPDHYGEWDLRHAERLVRHG